MSVARMPSKKELKLMGESLEYSPESGDLTWRSRPRSHFSSDRQWHAWNQRYAGREAGASQKSKRNTYRQVWFSGRNHKAHRICWFLHSGEWPQGHLDHVDGCGTNNSISNLRVVGNRENHKNMRAYASSKSGITGVNWCAANGKWHARIKVEGKNIHLGYFDCLDDARSAREAADNQHGFHENHGRRLCV